MISTGINITSAIWMTRIIRYCKRLSSYKNSQNKIHGRYLRARGGSLPARSSCSSHKRRKIEPFAEISALTFLQKQKKNTYNLHYYYYRDPIYNRYNRGMAIPPSTDLLLLINDQVCDLSVHMN